MKMFPNSFVSFSVSFRMFVFLCLAGTVHAEQFGDFLYSASDGSVSITGYLGPGGDVIIPSELEGLPVTEIGHEAFLDQSTVTTIAIPDTATSIAEEAFLGCSNLTEINVDAANPAYSSIEGILFNKSQTILEQCPGGRAGPYVVPDGVTVIGHWGFAYCANLTSVSLPDGLTDISHNAFIDCDGLTSITLPESVTRIDYEAFVGCGGLTHIVIPASVTGIGNEAFYGCINLTSATFEGNAPAVGIGIFDNVAPDFTLYTFEGSTGYDANRFLDAAHYPSETLEVLDYESWPALSDLPADKRDPEDRNGPLNLPNRVAYAMGLHPEEAVPGDLPSVVSFDSAEDGIRFRFRRTKNTPDVVLAPKTSTNLIDWFPAEILQKKFTHDGGAWEILEITVATSSDDRLFFRLETEDPQ